jgi:hypothetical protein
MIESCFQRTILSGYVLCGGPCFYTYTICYLWKYLYFKFEMELNKPRIYSFMIKIHSIFENYFRHLLIHDIYDYYIQIESGHLFYNSNKYCECELFEKIETNQKIDAFSNDFNINQIDFNRVLNNSVNSNKVPKILDCFESKLNSLNVVKNILSTAFQIGVFISD